MSSIISFIIILLPLPYLPYHYLQIYWKGKLPFQTKFEMLWNTSLKSLKANNVERETWENQKRRRSGSSNIRLRDCWAWRQTTPTSHHPCHAMYVSFHFVFWFVFRSWNSSTRVAILWVTNEVHRCINYLWITIIIFNFKKILKYD